MSCVNMSSMARLTVRNVGQSMRRQATRSTFRRTLSSQHRAVRRFPQIIMLSRSAAFSTSGFTSKGLSPDSEDPQPKEAEDISTSMEPVELTDEKYHELSDLYIDNLVAKLEELQEGRDDVDVEYSAGVLTVLFPPTGTYVINKQPPNKQIWLSSPTSGPKRYDYVVVGEGQHEKEGSGSGDWVYIRDGSTLSEVILKEIGVDVHAIDIEESGPSVK